MSIPSWFNSNKFFKPFRVAVHIQDEIERGGKFQILLPPLRALTGFHFVQFSREIDGIGQVSGLGVSKSLKKAQIIAYFEFLDRLGYFKFGEAKGLISSNGVAAHKFQSLAVISAKREIHERDSILAHWYTETGFKHLDNFSHDIKCISDELKSSGFTLRMVETFLGIEKTTICILINDATGRFCIGSSAGSDPASREKAAIEAVINLKYGNHGKNTEDLIEALNKSGIVSLEAHRSYWLHLHAIPEWAMKEAKRVTPNRRAIVEYKVDLLTSDPYPVVVVRSAPLLELSVGPAGVLEREKLTQRFPDIIIPEVLKPHPIF